MQEHEVTDEVMDSDWVVASDGITFYVLPDLDAMLDEELKGRAAIKSLIDSRSIAEILRDLGKDIDKYPF